MQLHDIQAQKNKSKKRIGRGGTRGKTSGRGHKGQKARAGHSIRPEMRDIIKKIPKLRGRGKNKNTSINNAPYVVSLEALEARFEKGDEVNMNTLKDKGLVPASITSQDRVKILSNGIIKKSLAIKGCLVSKTAKEAILKVGGSIE